MLIFTFSITPQATVKNKTTFCPRIYLDEQKTSVRTKTQNLARTKISRFIFLLCFINLLIISRYNDRRYDLEDILVSWYFTTDSGKAGSAVALNVILPQRGKNVEDDVFLKTSSSTTTLSVSYSYRSESTIRYCKKLAAHMDRVAHN